MLIIGEDAVSVNPDAFARCSGRLPERDLSGLFQGLFEVRPDVLNTLAADRKADEVVGDPGHLPMFLGKAGVGHAGRVLDEDDW